MTDPVNGCRYCGKDRRAHAQEQHAGRPGKERLRVRAATPAEDSAERIRDAHRLVAPNANELRWTCTGCDLTTSEAFGDPVGRHTLHLMQLASRLDVGEAAPVDLPTLEALPVGSTVRSTRLVSDSVGGWYLPCWSLADVGQGTWRGAASGSTYYTSAALLEHEGPLTVAYRPGDAAEVSVVPQGAATPADETAVRLAATESLLRRAIAAHRNLHRVYGSTATCRGGVGGQSMTTHCGVICHNPAHGDERDAWEQVESDFFDLTTPPVAATSEEADRG